MVAKLRHLAIVSHRHHLIGRFYEDLFGLKSSTLEGLTTAAVVSDGYVGLNVNPRAPGRQGGLDHFGFEVDSVEGIETRLQDAYPSIELTKRPGGRPFAGLSMHDPVGNVFDLSQAEMENRTSLYVDDVADNPTHVDHVVLRVVEAERAARFYMEVFDLDEMEKGPSDPNYYLSDGRITFMILPWHIGDYLGGGIERPALEHIGFRVDSIDDVLSRLEEMVERNPELAPKPWKPGPEGEVRVRQLALCPRGEYQLCDPDGVLIDLMEG
jgi:catechol 2,3-dioxygenase-like lactoylglutathione lyase family enzyme